MTRSPFGWSLPPGAAGDPNAPWNQSDPPCGVCGQAEDDCLCPECPTCGAVGDPACYDGQYELSILIDGKWKNGGHGTPEQVHAWAELERVGPLHRPTQLVRMSSHGLVRSLGQVALLAEVERLRAEEDEHYRRLEAEYEGKLSEEELAHERYLDSLEWDGDQLPTGIE